MSIPSDVLIVGGGINGVSIAYHLARHGVKVTLVEKSSLGDGPSGQSSAIVRQHYSNPVTARMALDSLRVWQNFPEIVGGPEVFTPTGFLMGVRPGDLDTLKANLAMQQSVGIDTRFITTDELKELEPHIDPSGLGGAAYEPESGYCDPVQAINGFAKGIQRLGGRIISGVRMTGLRRLNGTVLGIETTQGFLPAGAVVIAAGPWSKAILAELGVDIPMITARVKIGLYRRPPEFDRHRIWGDFVTQVYLRPETGGLMLVGSLSPDEETGDLVADPDSFNERVELDVISSFAERAAHRYPAMTRSHLASSYSSIYDITPDWHHLMDAVAGVAGLYLCAGGSGHGFKLAPAVGRMMASLVIDGKQAQDEINLFSLERFQTGKLVRGQYECSILG